MLHSKLKNQNEKKKTKKLKKPFKGKVYLTYTKNPRGVFIRNFLADSETLLNLMHYFDL